MCIKHCNSSPLWYLVLSCRNCRTDRLGRLCRMHHLCLLYTSCIPVPAPSAMASITLALLPLLSIFTSVIDCTGSVCGSNIFATRILPTGTSALAIRRYSIGIPKMCIRDRRYWYREFVNGTIQEGVWTDENGCRKKSDNIPQKESIGRMAYLLQKYTKNQKIDANRPSGKRCV